MASASLLCAAGTASAQNANNRGPTVVDELVVTADKVEQLVQKAPVTVTVLGEKRLQEMGATNFQDYAGSIPALTFMALAPGEQRILLRGVSDGVDTSLRGATQNVTGVYINDMVVSNNYTSPDLNLFDVNRIEVLKGPQGTLYGDGSVGGLIRIITNEPDLTQFEAEVEATAGVVNKGGGDYALNGMVNMPLVEGKLALRIVGQWARNDGSIDDVLRNIEDVNTVDQYGGRASLLWTPTENISLTLSALSQRTKLGGGSDYNILLGDLKRGSIFAETLDTTFRLYNVTGEWDVGWGTLMSSTSYATYDRVGVGDFTDFLSTIFPVILPSRNDHGNNSTAFSEELRISSPVDRKLRWLAGFYYSNYTEDNFEHDLSIGLFDFFRDVIGQELDDTIFDVGDDIIFKSGGTSGRRVIAGFGEATYNITDRISITGGARYFRDRLTNEDTVGGVVTGVPQFNLSEETEDEGWVFRFRVANQITDNILVYALASEGYRTGGLNPLNPATINDPTFPVAFEPDSLWNYEVGWKTRLFDNRLTLNGAAYYIDWDNIQIQVGLPSGFSIIANAGSAKIKGVELEATLRPTDGLELGLSGSLIDARLGQDTLGLGLKGDRLTGVPRHQGNIFAQWTFPAFGRFDGFVRGDIQHVGKIQRFFNSDVDAYGDYTLINLRGGIQNDELSLIFFVENLGDERAALFKGGQATSSPIGRTDVFVYQPRTIGVTVRKRF